MGNFTIVEISPELMPLEEAAQELGVTPAGVAVLVGQGLVREFVNTRDVTARLVVCSDVARIGQLAALLRDYQAPATDPDPDAPPAVAPRPRRDGFAA